MITRIELTNFMSHVHTVIEPAAGLTVLVGPNNCGKSALVAALQILCRNEASTYVLRHGERECSVKVVTDDGHTVEWKRKSRPSYVIDGKSFDRLGRTGLPDELHQALRLPKVAAGDETDFDVHFGTQKSPIFLLGHSPTNAARFFASSSDAIRLVQMQKRHREKLQEAQREKTRSESESLRVNGELKTLEPAVELEHQVKSLEAEHARLVGQAGDIAALATAVDEHQRLERAAVERAAEAQALAALQPPPPLAPLESLATLAGKLDSARQHCEITSARAAALELVQPLPEMHDVAALAALLQRASALDRAAAMGDSTCQVLSEIAAPPVLADANSLQALLGKLVRAEQRTRAEESKQAAVIAIQPPHSTIDTTPLESLVNRLDALSRQATEALAALNAIQAEAMQAADELREFAAGSHCPVCGGPLDAERLLAGAAAGVGGHSHG
jgi:exonuclease SbcC